MRIAIINSRIAALTAIIALPLAAQAQNIDTISLWDGTLGLDAWYSGSPTFGQTITAPTGATTLDTFDFRVAGWNGPFSGSYEAYVYNWDPVGRVLMGSPLWSSGPLTVGPVAPNDYVPLNFVPNVAVTPNSSYVLFTSFLGQPAPTNGALWGFVGGSPNVYSGGELVWSNDPSFGTLSTNAWDTLGGRDSAFTATFSSSNLTPEIPGGMLLLPALLPFGLMAARKRFKKAA
jgi:hypothetical protein